VGYFEFSLINVRFDITNSAATRTVIAISIVRDHISCAETDKPQWVAIDNDNANWRFLEMFS